MHINSVLKIWLLSDNFEKFTSINEDGDKSQPSVWKDEKCVNNSYEMFFLYQFKNDNNQ